MSPYEKWTLGILSLTLLAVAVYTAFTGYMAWTARNTAERQLRAYVGPYEMELVVYPYEEGGFVAMSHVELRNFGQTPAYDLTSSVWCGLHEPDAAPFKDVEEPHELPKAGAAFPHAGFHARVPCFLSEAQVAELRDRKKVVFFWGTITYRDAFKKPRFFTFRLVSQERTLDQGEVYRMGPHASGYDAN